MDVRIIQNFIRNINSSRLTGGYMPAFSDNLFSGSKSIFSLSPFGHSSLPDFPLNDLSYGAAPSFSGGFLGLSSFVPFTFPSISQFSLPLLPSLKSVGQKILDSAPVKAIASTFKATVGKWAKPVKGVVTSVFGRRSRPTKGASSNHKGMDIGAKSMTPVYAPADGKITTSGRVGGYGNAIYMDNGNINGVNVTSRYGHLSKSVVRAGQTVKKGQLIGYVGSTGVSTGPHLHFEVRENGTAVNPTKYIGNYA